MNPIKLITTYLQRNKVKFALTGAFAMSAWGVVRASQDIDFAVVASGKSHEKILNFAKKHALSVVESTERQIILRNEQTLFDYDFIFIHDTVTGRMYKNSRLKYVYGKKIKIASPEDLIISKLFRLVISYNHNDVSDILALATMNALNASYLCPLIRRDSAVYRVLRNIAEEAGKHRYRFGNLDLTAGARRLSACL